MIGWNDLVLEPLEENQRARQAVDEVDRRPRAIDIPGGRIRADHGVEIARLELVRVLGERLDVADAVIARARPEHLRMKRQRRQRRVAAGAAAADDQPLGIRPSLLDQIFRGIDAVVDVHDSPLPVEALRYSRP